MEAASELVSTIERILSGYLDLVSIAFSLCFSAIAQLKKRFVNQQSFSLGTYLSDALTLAVIVPLFNLVLTAWIEPSRLVEIVQTNLVLLTIALLVTALILLRTVFFPVSKRHLRVEATLINA